MIEILLSYKIRKLTVKQYKACSKSMETKDRNEL